MVNESRDKIAKIEKNLYTYGKNTTVIAVYLNKSMLFSNRWIWEVMIKIQIAVSKSL